MAVDEDTTEEFLIPREYIDAWFEIPPLQTVHAELPRVALDALYTGIEGAYSASILLAESVMALAEQIPGSNLDRQQFVDQLTSKVVKGVNGLRHFQTIIMEQATRDIRDARNEVDGTGGDEASV